MGFKARWGKKIMDASPLAHVLAPTAAGATIGGGVGAYKSRNQKKGKIDAILRGARKGGSIGLLGGLWAAGTIKRMKNPGGRSYGGYGRSGSSFRSPRPSSSDLGTIGVNTGAKTKKEVTDAYKKMVKKHHPDLGGDTAKMQEVNSAMDNIKKTDWFQKLAYLMIEKTAKKKKEYKPKNHLADAMSSAGKGALLFGPLGGLAGGFSSKKGRGMETSLGGLSGAILGRIASGAIRKKFHLNMHPFIQDRIGSSIGGSLGAGLFHGKNKEYVKGKLK